MFYLRIFTLSILSVAIHFTTFSTSLLIPPPLQNIKSKFCGGGGVRREAENIVKCNNDAKEDTVKVLINKSYGNFTFSETFYNEYDKTYGSGSLQTLLDTDFFVPNKYGNIETRYDHKIIELYERLGGSYACSGEFSKLCTIEIPRVLTPYIVIDKYDGSEIMSVCLYKMYRKLLDDILSRRQIRFYDILIYEDIRNWERYLSGRDLHFY